MSARSALCLAGICSLTLTPYACSADGGSAGSGAEADLATDDMQAEGSRVDASRAQAGDARELGEESETRSEGERHSEEGSEEGAPPRVLGPAKSCLEDEGVIQETPELFSDYIAHGFTRYTEVLAPNGKPIRIFAADQITDEMIFRARNVLGFFLTDVPGSQYGQDKGAVADSMANYGATLMLPNGAHEEGNEPPLNAQPLYQNEMSVEGGAWYLHNNWEHRDATFEEIFHLVHDTGIGTYVPGALPDYQAALRKEAEDAIADGRWGIPIDPSVSEWLEELSDEDSLAQEYIASVIDSYYGYWGAFDEAPGGMWGLYIAKDRAEIGEKDPKGLALLEAFLPPMADYEARLSSGFEGTFEMRFDPGKPYTHKSRYLVAVTLGGEAPSSIQGNDADNRLRGNVADNTLNGAGGEDLAIYCQPREAYSVSREGEELIIEGPDGRDRLISIEAIHFADGLYASEAL